MKRIFSLTGLLLHHSGVGICNSANTKLFRLQNIAKHVAKFFYVTKIYILFYENINFMEVFGNNFVLSLGRDIRDSPFSCSVCITVQKHCNLRLSNF